MLDKPISPLRQRMIDDMTARRFKEKVQKDYVRHVRTFAAFLGRSPDTAMSEDLRRFQLHMAQQQISAGSINAAIAALRFFFNVTLERPDLVRHRTTVNKPRKAPVVLSPEDDESDRCLRHCSTLATPICVSSVRLSSICQLSVMRPFVTFSRSVAMKSIDWPWPLVLPKVPVKWPLKFMWTVT